MDDTIKEPGSASRIGVVIKWHVLELSILRQEIIFEFHTATNDVMMMMILIYVRETSQRV